MTHLAANSLDLTARVVSKLGLYGGIESRVPVYRGDGQVGREVGEEEALELVSGDGIVHEELLVSPQECFNLLRSPHQLLQVPEEGASLLIGDGRECIIRINSREIRNQCGKWMCWD